MTWITPGAALAVCAVAIPAALAAGTPAAYARNGDTHITGQGTLGMTNRLMRAPE